MNYFVKWSVRDLNHQTVNQQAIKPMNQLNIHGSVSKPENCSVSQTKKPITKSNKILKTSELRKDDNKKLDRNAEKGRTCAPNFRSI